MLRITLRSANRRTSRSLEVNAAVLEDRVGEQVGGRRGDRPGRCRPGPCLKRSMIASRVGVVAAERDQVVVVEVDAVGAELGELLQRVTGSIGGPGGVAERVAALPADGPQAEGELVVRGRGGDLMVTMVPSVWWVGSGPGLGAVAQLGVALADVGVGSASSAPQSPVGQVGGSGCRRAPRRPGGRRRGRRTPRAAARRPDGRGSPGPARGRRRLRAAPPTSSTRPPPRAPACDEQVDGVGERAEQRLERGPGEVGAGRGRPQPGPGARWPSGRLGVRSPP